jgi:hypothetical protein
MLLNFVTLKSLLKNKYLILKFFSILVMVFWGFGQPYVFNRYLAANNFSFITIGYGVILFLDLFDFGISRAIYADIRNKFIKDIDYKKDLSVILKIYLYVLLYTIILFVLFLFIISIKVKSSFSAITIILWGISIALNANFSYFRYILFAIDEYIFFEKMDVLRKLINFLLLFVIVLDNSFFIFSTLSILMFAFIYFGIYRVLMKTHKIKLFAENHRVTLKIFRQYIINSKWPFLFSVSQITCLNSGFLILPLALINKDIIQYGLWQKFAYGITMLIVAVSDLGLHNTTKYYFKNDFISTKKIFNKTIFVSIMCVCILFVFIFVAKKILFHYWVDESYEFSLIMFLGLLLFFIGRSFQYISTTLILSFGNNYSKLARISTTFMITYHLVLFYMLSKNLKLEYILLLFGFTILIEGVKYLMFFNQELNKELSII